MLKKLKNVLKTKFSNYIRSRGYRKNVCIHGYIFDPKDNPGEISCNNGNVNHGGCFYSKQYMCPHYSLDGVILCKRICIYTVVMVTFLFFVTRWLFF